MPRVYTIHLDYVVQLHPRDDGTYPEGEDLGRELAWKTQEAFDQNHDSKQLDPAQYDLLEEEPD